MHTGCEGIYNSDVGSAQRETSSAEALSNQSKIITYPTSASSEIGPVIISMILIAPQRRSDR